MTKHKTVDARGLDCPKPVIMTRDVIDGGADTIEVLVDNNVALENVTRFLQNAGYTVQYPEDKKGMKIHAFRENDQTPAANLSEDGNPNIGNDYSFLILSDVIGAQSDSLGEVLMKSFLGTLPSLKPLPKTIALMNDGVKLALPESTCSETLRNLSFDGVRVLVCGTCTKHFEITEQIIVGDISNMFEITEKIFGASKPIVIG